MEIVHKKLCNQMIFLEFTKRKFCSRKTQKERKSRRRVKAYQVKM